MRITIAGYYGMKNFGDDLFVGTLVERLKGHDLCVLSPPIPGVSARYLVPSAMRGTFSSVGVPGRAFRTVIGTAVGLSGRAIILGGGSVLHGRSAMLGCLLRAGSLRGSDLTAVGVSVGPFEDQASEDRVRRQTMALRVIGVRDAASVDFINASARSRCLWTGDIAALHSAFAKGQKKCEGRPLIIPCNALAAPEYCEALLRSRSKLLKSEEVTILIANCHPRMGDMAVGLEVARMLTDRGFSTRVVRYDSMGIDRTLDLVRSAEFVISGRLHGGIVSYLTGVPFVLLDYHRKCRDFLAEIGYQGLASSPLVPAHKFRRRTEDAWRIFEATLG